MPLRSLIACLLLLLSAVAVWADCEFEHNYGNRTRQVQCSGDSDTPCTITPATGEVRETFNVLFIKPYFSAGVQPRADRRYPVKLDSLKPEVRNAFIERCPSLRTPVWRQRLRDWLSLYLTTIAYGFVALLVGLFLLVIVWRLERAHRATRDEFAKVLEATVASLQQKIDGLGTAVDALPKGSSAPKAEPTVAVDPELHERMVEIRSLLENETLWQERMAVAVKVMSGPPPPPPSLPVEKKRSAAPPPVPGSWDIEDARLLPIAPPPAAPPPQKKPSLDPIAMAWRLAEQMDVESGMSSANYAEVLLQNLEVLPDQAVSKGGVIRVDSARAPVSKIVTLDQGDFFGILPRGADEYVIFPRIAMATTSEKYQMLLDKLFVKPAGWVPHEQRIGLKCPARIHKNIFDSFLDSGQMSVVKVDTFDVTKGELVLA